MASLKKGSSAQEAEMVNSLYPLVLIFTLEPETSLSLHASGLFYMSFTLVFKR